MQRMLTTVSILIASWAAQAGLTTTQTYLSIDRQSPYGIVYKAQSLDAFCRGVGLGVQFGSFEVAQQAEAMNDGFYDCAGQFVRQPNAGLTIFKIESCVVQDPAQLDCPKL